MRLRLIVFALCFAALGWAVQSNAAQNGTTADVCSTFIRDALSTVGNNCGQLQRNSACYGYNTVQAEFIAPQADTAFVQPNDRSNLDIISRITTSPLRTTANDWGIALMSLQANLPDTLPGQSVIFMLLGATEVENDVDPVNDYKPGTIIMVTTAVGGNLLYQPRTDADLVGFVPENTPLQADAISSDGGFVRVVYQGLPGWVTIASLTGGVDLTGLGVISPDTRTPGQAFYLRTSIGQTDCVQAPDSLVVQGPKGIKVDLNANGADFRIGSTVILRVIPIAANVAAGLQQRFGFTDPIAGLLELTTIDGEAILDPDTPNEQHVPAGQRAYRCLANPEDIALDGDTNDNKVIDACPWFNFETLTPTQLQEFSGFVGITLNYPIELPLDETPTPTNTLRPISFGFFPTNTPHPTNTLEFPTNTSAPAATATNTPPSGTPTDTDTPSKTPTSTDTPTSTYTPTATFTPTATDTSTATFTPTPSNTATYTPTATDTSTATFTPTATYTPTDTPTPTPTSTDVPPSCAAPIPNPINTVAQFICAIELANDESNFPGQDTLNLANTTFTFTSEYAPGLALPPITSNIVVVGNNATLDVDAAAPAMRFFYVEVGGALELNTQITLQNGTADNSGGAIYSEGDLIIKNSNLKFNNAPSGDGGAIYQEDGTLQVITSNITDNTAAGMGGGISGIDANMVISGTFLGRNTALDGGGISSYGSGTSTLLITSSTVSDNDTSGGHGGGVYFGATTGTATITNNSFVETNTAVGKGGGIYNGGTSSPISKMTIDHTTINGNTADIGGGVASCSSGGITIFSSTLSRNTATGGGGFYGCATESSTVLNITVSNNSPPDGLVHDGIAHVSFTTIAYNSGTGLSGAGTVNIHNSIVADNTGTQCSVSTLNTSGANYTDNDVCAGMVLVTDAALDLDAALQNNGGVTETHALGDSSVALDQDACDDVFGATVDVDQRDAPRPSFNGCDPGSYENQNAGNSTGGSAGEVAPLPTDTLMDEPTLVPADESTATLEPSLTPMDEPSATLEPTLTSTDSPTEEATLTPSDTLALLLTPTGSPTAAPESTEEADALSKTVAMGHALDYGAWVKR